MKFFHLRNIYESFKEPDQTIIATIAYTEDRSGVCIWDQRERHKCSKRIARRIAKGRLEKGVTPNYPRRTVTLDMQEYDLQWVIETKTRLLQEELGDKEDKEENDSLYLQTR
jgi:bifunctional N-acetylglucosamine-1-phosphate-uridyltransferase/glucosamine-1-phosphate-acetyltransferase GlmU-like protein